jgi:hypothetical protein
MSDEQEKSTRRPTHRLYLVTGEGEASTWIAIGAAWPHKDGQGFNVVCDAVPLTGRMVLRAPEDERS